MSYRPLWRLVALAWDSLFAALLFILGYALVALGPLYLNTATIVGALVIGIIIAVVPTILSAIVHLAERD